MLSRRTCYFIISDKFCCVDDQVAVYRIEKSDEGIYTCQASNGVDVQSASTTITVQVAGMCV